MNDEQRRPQARDADEEPQDSGAYIGSQPELAAETIPGGLRPEDERVASEATQKTGPAQRGANPDEGWQDAPEGHREGRAADDDLVRRKG